MASSEDVPNPRVEVPLAGVVPRTGTFPEPRMVVLPSLA